MQPSCYLKTKCYYFSKGELNMEVHSLKELIH